MLWLGLDLYRFVESRGSVQGLPLRILYVFLSETGKPVLPVMLGSFLAGMFSRRYRPAASAQDGSPFAGEVSTTESPEANSDEEC